MRPSRLRWLSALAVLPLPLAACGGGSPSAAPAPATVTVTASTAPPPAAPAAPPSAPAPGGLPGGLPTGAPPPGPGSISGGTSFSPRFNSAGVADPASWPDACKMLTNDDLRKVISDLEDVQRQGQRGSFTSGGETPYYVNCRYTLKLGRDELPGENSHVEVKLDAVAEPKFVAAKHRRDKEANERSSKQFPEFYEDYGTKLGADDCFLAGNELKCMTGPFSFSVGGRAVGGLGADFKKTKRDWLEKELAGVVKVLSAKMKSGGTGGGIGTA